MIHPIVVGGTTESYPNDLRTTVPTNTMLHSVTKHLDPAHFAPARWVGYPAKYGDGGAYETSVNQGMWATLLAMLEISGSAGDNDPWYQDNHFWLIGYSQGATVIRRLNEELLKTNSLPVMRRKIAGISGVADPYRPVGVALGFDPGGFGVAGTANWDKGTPMLQIAASRDPICAAPYNSYIRTVADFTGYMSFTKPGDLAKWASEVIRRIQNRGWQNANLDWGQFWLTGMRVAEAVDQLGGYLPKSPLNPGGGRHTCYNIEKMPNSPFTYCERMAQEMNTIARRENL
ncbi:lysin B [Rhodococcus phage MacGully]|nr:lysin B [Rhodococcus phage MacGully]